MFSAASFAEEGATEAAREVMEGRKKVLLVLTGRQSDSRSVKHALNMALRNGADIEALVTCDGRPAAMAIDSLKAALAENPVKLSVTQRCGCIRESIIAQTRKRSDILCVVVESEGILDMECTHRHTHRHGKRDGIWRELTCPLSLVSERGSA